MGKASSERRAIVEGIVGVALGQLDLNRSISMWAWPWAAAGCVRGMRTWRSKALISRHLAMMASSSFGKSIDMVLNPC